MAGLSSNQIKFIRSLSQKKFRQQSGLFIAEGEKIVNEALSSPFEVEAVYRSSEIGEECMKRITNLATPSPVLAVIRQRKEQMQFNRNKMVETLKNSRHDSLYLALDGVKDPGNMGTIIRLADWFGIDAIFASHESVEIYNPKVVQATMGAIFRKPVIYADLEEVVDTFHQAGMPVYGTFLDGADIYETAGSVEKKGLIVMGSESFGISEKLERKITSKLLIPPYPANSTTSESLNVAIATAIICAEFRRP